jgi:hypothetical protein
LRLVDSEARAKLGAYDVRKDEDEPEEAEAVQGGDSALRANPIDQLEPGPDLGAEAEQPRDIA